MKKLFAILLVVLVMSVGVAFIWSCGGGGGGGGEDTVDLDMDGFDSSVDCDDSASSCTDDCISDVDGDGIDDCLDLCIDTDLDGYGTDNSSTIVGSGSDDVGSCTSDGATSCTGGGGVCLGLDCDDDPAGGYSINPGVTEVCDDGTDNDCDDLTDCYDTTICAADSACTACTDFDADGYLAIDVSCAGGDDCDDDDYDTNPGGTGAFGCPVQLCTPCVTDTDCGTGNRCINLDGADICVADCSVSSLCPTGFTCTDIGAGDMQCVPTSDSCDCLPGDEGLTRSCDETNAFGTCSGDQTCDPASGWSACTAPTPEAEICDGTDNDCDGSDDEDFTDLNDACSTGLGICYDTGTIVCTGDGTGTECDAVPGPKATETCNGLDDDCDGSTDEDYSAGGTVTYTDLDGTTGLVLSDSCGVGVCSGGEVVCSGSGTDLTCSTAGSASAETCNGVDDDCDGSVDELGAQPCYDGDPATRNVGECTDGTRICSGGEWGTCIGQVTPTTETCNGLDEDCDGDVDDGNPGGGGACVTGLLGVCAAGTDNCVGGGITCVQNVSSSPEVCNGLDDDCDGTPDEGNPGGGASCDGADTDLCEEGTTSCSGGALVCSDNTSDDLDLCDGTNEDCDDASADGSEDPQNGVACDGADSDLCPEGNYSCSGGALVCSDATGDDLDICNNTDDDCDGASADGSEDPLLGDGCDGSDTDLCIEGTYTGCSGGALTCSDSTGNDVEICNNFDDDCNLIVDDGDPCGGYACQSETSTCLASCTSNADCYDGYYCDVSNMCQAQKSPGESCTTESECTSGFCIDSVCCDTSCDSLCQKCDIAGNLGLCLYLQSGTDPDDECVGTSNCDGSGGSTP